MSIYQLSGTLGYARLIFLLLSSRYPKGPRRTKTVLGETSKTFRLLDIKSWILKQDNLAGTALAAPDRSIDAVGVEVAVLFDVPNKDAAVIDDQNPIGLQPFRMLNGHIAPK